MNIRHRKLLLVLVGIVGQLLKVGLEEDNCKLYMGNRGQLYSKKFYFPLASSGVQAGGR
jgi:hypothetical protein